MTSKLNLTPVQRKVIDCANRLYEEIGYEDVDVLDIYISTDLELEEINDAIDTCPVLRTNKDGVIVECPDSAMLKNEYGL